jgi:pimeloyl-ACP methyl ester carboxylesterase
MKNLIFLFFSLIFIGCSTEEEVNITLVGNEKILAYSTGEAKLAFSAIGMDAAHADLLYRFDVYNIQYNTKYGDRQVKASALVAVPKTDEAMPIISFQHGTIAAHRQAPSENLSSQLPLFSLASTGYIVVIPDYIGFGNSNDIFHPYYIAEPMGRSVRDAILAAKELTGSLEGKFNGNIFLAGYSEGGYATMAAHKHIEENVRGDINLVASAPAAGGYDVKGMQEYFFDAHTYEEPFYMAYVALAYKNYYDWNEPLTTYFQEPYASKLEGLFNGELSGGQINAALTERVADLLQPDMLENFESSAKYRHLKEALEANSLTNWEPVAPIWMYHGTDDITVPYRNSVASHTALAKDADSQELIVLIPLEGKTHSSGVLPYIKDVYYRFKALK